MQNFLQKNLEIKVQKLSEKIYCWSCDYSPNTGEGNLSRLFISKKIKKKIIYHPKIFLSKKSFLNYKYFIPFVGVFFCWYYYFQNKKVAYINYLPLWNFIIFILLPPKTLIGPITGGSKFSKKSNYLIRKYIFPIFYKISEIVILIRFQNPIFSTSLLKKYLFKKTIKRSNFDFVFEYIKIKKKIKKNIDFLIYFKDHKNKKKLINFKLLKRILKLNFKVYCVGDYLKIPKIKNLKLVSKVKLNKILSRTRFSLCSEENFYSLYALDCINNNVKIVTCIKNKKYINKYKESFIFVNNNLSNLKAKLVKR